LPRRHNYRRQNRRAVFVANIMEQLTQFRIISLGLQVLLLFIGALTLGIAASGLMKYHAGECAARRARLESRRPWVREKAYPAAVSGRSAVISGVGGAGACALAYAVARIVGKITFYSALASHADAGDIHLIISPTV